METYIIFSNINFLEIDKTFIKNKASVDMTLNEFKNLTSICWNEKYQLSTTVMTKDKHTGRHRLGLKSIFVPDSSPL